MDTYAHTQDKPRLELAEKIEANFYTQDLTPAAPQPRQNEKPAATKITGKEILEAIRLMDAEERRELTRALFAYLFFFLCKGKQAVQTLRRKTHYSGNVQMVCRKCAAAFLHKERTPNLAT